jgi:uncharacterized protein YegL
MTQITTILQFHSEKLTGNNTTPENFEYPVVFPGDDQYYFGTLDISTAAADPIPYTWDVKFSIDNSGSMSDQCRDGRTKLQHIKHTLGNIIRLFASYKSMTFNVCIHTFNDQTEQIIDFTTISDSNLEEILAKISTIYDTGSTNLLKPITETTEQMKARSSIYPNNKQLHFLLTDGIDSCDNNSNTIVGAVHSDYETVVFGFGIDHDSHTLIRIGDKPNCNYGFIAEIEKAGIIYGEYIHNILYRVCTDISIELQSAEIYSWKTNTWENVLRLDSLASELTKTYYVRTKADPREITGVLNGRLCTLSEINSIDTLDHIEVLPDLLAPSGELIKIDLLDHMFRYKTLELLYEANSMDLQNSTGGFWRPRIVSRFNETITDIRKKLLTLYTNMRAYIKARYPSGSSFMESLLDDIYVSRLSFEKTNTRIFSLTRHRTQGNQNVYTPTSIDNFIDGTTQVAKYDTIDNDGRPVANDMEYQFSHHTISQYSNEAYTSPTLQNVIRSTSDI